MLYVHVLAIALLGFALARLLLVDRRAVRVDVPDTPGALADAFVDDGTWPQIAERLRRQ